MTLLPAVLEALEDLPPVRWHRARRAAQWLEGYRRGREVERIQLLGTHDQPAPISRGHLRLIR
ncbi:MAG: hypothetical protein ACRDOJ_12260 [Nocardioidaceae bacterium]